ncbi:MAG: hypothetical protein ABIQ06_13405 [Caldimonas sp.]
MTGTLSAEIAASAARLIVEEGLEYGAAKRRAARDLGAMGRAVKLPGNDEVEHEVRAYIDLFHADSQPLELAALRDIAAVWMERLASFRPFLTGAVWRGTATRLNDIHIELYCDDSKEAELALIDRRFDYEVSSGESSRGREVDVLNLFVPGPDPSRRVRIALTVLDYDDLRGALRADARGHPQRGGLAALNALRGAAA